MFDTLSQFMFEYGEETQVYLFFSLLAVFLILERFISFRHPADSQTKRWGTNAAFTITVILTMPLLPMSFLTAAFWAQNTDFGLVNMLSGTMPAWVAVLSTLLLRGFISFATHFFNHHVPLFWRLHRVHHMDTELDVSSTVRFHPLEMLVSLFIGLPMVLLFGLSPWVLIFYELFDVAVTLFSHSNIRIPPMLNRYLRYLIVTPSLHRVHHSCVEAETNSNYSAVFPVWDVIFGTFRTQTRAPLNTMRLGLEEVGREQANAYWWLLVSPLFNLNTRIDRTKLDHEQAV